MNLYILSIDCLSEQWILNGLKHRGEDMPQKVGWRFKEFRLYEYLHRESGPAYINTFYNKKESYRWFYYNREYDEKEFNKLKALNFDLNAYKLLLKYIL